MKIIKIFGIVMAVHAAAFIFVFATPGCRSTKRRSHSAAATVPAPVEAPTVSFPSPSTPSTPPTPAYDPQPSIYTPDLNPGTTPPPSTVSFDANASSNSNVRFNPSRPNTAVAEVLQTAPVRDVTPASTYTVGKGDNLWTIAKKNALNVNELAVANNLKPSSPVKIGQKLIIPTKSTPSVSSASTALGGMPDTLTYKVKAGETLGQIARKSGTTVAIIKSLNKLTSEILRAGQELTLPAGATSAAALAVETEPEPVKLPTKPQMTSRPHTVKSGETLGQIARRYGVTQRELAIFNHITDPLKLRAGQVIQIPGIQPVPAPAATPPPVPEVEASPISPIAPATESSPIAPAADSSPPIIRVDESPIAAPSR